MKKPIFILYLFLCFTANISAQNRSNWQLITETNIADFAKINRSSLPNSYFLYRLDLDAFKNVLLNAPIRGTANSTADIIIELPTATGVLEHYRVMETPILEGDLAIKFPMIKSYAAQGIESPTAIARFSITQFGLHSMTLCAGKSTMFIDPYTSFGDNYVVYNKSSLENNLNNFSCNTDQAKTIKNNSRDQSINRADADDNKLRTYRLAMSCTAEYGNIFAGTTGSISDRKANIQAQMAITMTRVNGVYENDLAITMVFIANNDLLIYLDDTSLDPWNGEYNLQTGLTIDATVGFNNYDIGHNFNTGGGGNAGCIGCVCGPDTNVNGNHKGTGMTGLSNPTGDPFDIDYVAHEIGHQFGGFHSQSSTNCRSGSGLTEVEPGSGSTIMGYAGICDSNVQSSSDPYFTYVNIRDILENVKNGISSSCAQINLISNNAPIVNAGKDYIIPKSTAFILTADASDLDNDAITYSWEQNDPESPGNTAAPTETRIAGPNFRSLNATTSNKRFFPDLNTVLAGFTFNDWEACPAVARNLNFSVLVRDNRAGGGQTASDLMKVTVKNTAGPFVVTSPNSNISWEAATNQTVTWNVAGTDGNGVDAKYVDIYLSTNGGQNFTTQLASQVPNDGSETITIPNIIGTQNRIIVKGFENIFYDLSNNNFTITAPGTTFATSFSGIEGEQTKFICPIASVDFNINIQNINNFAGAITFSATGLPSGATTTFSPSTATATGIVIMTIALPVSAAAGFYSIIVTATSGAVSKTIPFYLGLGIGAATLIVPTNNAVDLNTSLTLNWQVAVNAVAYDVEVATNANFTNIIASATVYTNSYIVTGLQEDIDYFWRVKPKSASCNGVFGDFFKFKTGLFYCENFIYSGNPVAIAASGTPTINSTIAIAGSFVLSDINITMNLTHSYINDLTATLISPSGTQIKLYDRPCTDAPLANINATFDDAGIALVCGTNPGVSGTIKSKEFLTAFNGQNAAGNWILRIKDNVNADGGFLVSWSMNMCSLSDITLSNTNFKLDNFALFPNPNNGSFNIQFQSDNSNKIDITVFDISGRNVFNKTFKSKPIFNENIILDQISSGVYLVNIKNGLKNETRKIIVD